MSMDADRRVGLARVKLQSLVQRAFPHVTAAAQPFNAGVGLVQGNQAFVSVVADAPSVMAATLAWGEHAGASELHVIVDEPDAVLALQAAGLDPSPTLWQADGVELVAMRAPDRNPDVDPPASALAQVPVLEEAGCDVVIEHGVVIGEVLGVEVARVVIEADGAATVRVGVGLYDQEAHAVMYADAAIADRLAQVRSEVVAHRRRGAGTHPLNLVARERWLRSILVGAPGLIGLDSLEPVASLTPRTGIREERPAAARGRRGADTVLVVCATGIDLDLVPEAAAHLGLRRADEVQLILPARDQHPVIERMAAHLAAPATLASVDTPWS